jgi:hypothetical protein
MIKYGYKRFEDVSGDMFEQLVAVTNKMTEHRQRTSRDAWYSVLSSAEMPLETKLTILASTAKGLDTNDIFNLTRVNPFASIGVGNYERVFADLIRRHEAAKERARMKRLNPPPKKRPVSEAIFDLEVGAVEVDERELARDEQAGADREEEPDAQHEVVDHARPPIGCGRSTPHRRRSHPRPDSVRWQPIPCQRTRRTQNPSGAA